MKVSEKDVENLKRLPDWVKCAVCRKPPTAYDWLIEIVPNSTALIHQSCARGQGKLVGLDIKTDSLTGGD